MFGYIRPSVGELKVKEFGRFRACYCGLCHELGGEYGFPARFILNYDFVFLAMLLWHGGKPEYCFRRCAASPLRRRCVCAGSEPLRRCAGYSVILAWWKLRDTVADDGFFKRTAARAEMLLLRRSYLKAAADFPEFDGAVRKSLSELSELERQGERSLDRSADKFAALLASAADAETDETARRTEAQVLYHTGRIIYIADAYQDLADDMKRGRYNPLAARFSLTSPALSAADRETVRLTLENSLRLAETAFDLLPDAYWSGALRNIIVLGIREVCGKVLDGTFVNTRAGVLRQRSMQPVQIGDRTDE